MAAGDARRAIRYLTVVVLAYLLVAYSVGRGVHLLEVGVLIVGIIALVIAAQRLGD